MAASPTSLHTSLRIIGGTWNGRQIRFRTATGLRPSSNRLRESLFSCLHSSGALSGLNCLDLFAGSGVLGLSAASHGAGAVTFVEKNRARAISLRRLIDTLAAPAQVVALPAERFLRRPPPDIRFDVVFLDPPFSAYPDDSSWQQLLTAVIPFLAANARIYCENARLFNPPDCWQRLVKRRTGMVHWQILRLAT